MKTPSMTIKGANMKNRFSDPMFQPMMPAPLQEDDPTTDPNCGSSQNESRVGNYVPPKKS